MMKTNTTRLAITVLALLTFLWILNDQLRFVPVRPGFLPGDTQVHDDAGVGFPLDREGQDLDVHVLPHTESASSSATATESAGAVSTSTFEAPVASIPEKEGSFELQADKIVVTGHTVNEDASWIRDDLPMWQHAIYSVDDATAPLHTSQNKGREGNIYLNYLVDNYDKLPATIAFIHPHKEGYPQAWHNDADGYSNAKALQSLNLDFVQKNGYVNLRCIFVPGCPDEIQPFRPWDSENRTAEHAYGQVWKDLFNNTDVPERVGTPCCAQFAVSRDQVHKRPKEHYIWFHQYLMASKYDDATIGRVYEYLWHIIFGKDPVYCPPLDQCYAEVYNRATLAMGMGG